MEENNLSTKMEVLTAYLNVLTERSAINALEREKYNRAVDLLRLIGYPVGADKVKFEGQMDNFALDENKFDMNDMILLALAQSSQVALADAYVAEQQRVLDQLRYEYMPDLRASTGYQDENGKIGADLFNDDDTWGLDVFGQPKMPGQKGLIPAGTLVYNCGYQSPKVERAKAGKSRQEQCSIASKQLLKTKRTVSNRSYVKDITF